MRVLIAFVAMLVLVGCSSNDAGEQPGTSAPVEPAANTATDEIAGCTTNEDCAENDYCAKPTGECDSDAGECKPRPEICTHNWDPVCGCDGKTYGNVCGAASAGQNVAFKGECKKPEGEGG